MGHDIEKMEGKIKKTAGKLTGNKKMEMKGAVKESMAKMKGKFD